MMDDELEGEGFGDSDLEDGEFSDAFEREFGSEAFGSEELEAGEHLDAEHPDELTKPVNGQSDRERVSKWDRAARFLQVARVLHGNPQGVTAAQIAERIGVSKRTVYRDLQAMESDGKLPIWQEGGRWGMNDDAFLPPLALTLHEAVTLFLAARLLAKTNDEYDPELMGALSKLAEVLPEVLQRHIQISIDALAQRPHNERFTRVLRALAQAWAQRRVVTIEYDATAYAPDRGIRTTRVRPYALEPSALTHALYLIGWDEQRGDRRTFKVERIVSASVTPETFEAASSARASEELLRAWDIISDEPSVDVVVRFTPAVARRVAETHWHASQELTPQPDGSLLWRGQVSGTHEIRVWILSWGADAEVIEPAGLRAEVADHFRRAAERYQ